MNFLADESIDKQIVIGLRKKDFNVGYVAELDPGISDDEVLDIANINDVPLLTADKDFGELIFRLKKTSSGVILVRLAGLSSNQKTNIAVSLINEHFNELIEAFSVITPSGIRIRHQSK